MEKLKILENTLPIVLGVALGLTVAHEQQASKTSLVRPVSPVSKGAPPMPEMTLLKIDARCDGSIPVVDVLGFAKSQKFGVPRIDLLVVERGRNFRILDEWTADALTKKDGEYLRRTYRGFASEVGIYRDSPVAPLEWLEGKQYQVSVKSSTLEIKNGRRDARFVRELYRRSVTIPECAAKPRWSKH